MPTAERCDCHRNCTGHCHNPGSIPFRHHHFGRSFQRVWTRGVRTVFVSALNADYCRSLCISILRKAFLDQGTYDFQIFASGSHLFFCYRNHRDKILLELSEETSSEPLCLLQVCPCTCYNNRHMAERIKRIKEEVSGVVSIMGSLYFFLSSFHPSFAGPCPLFSGPRSRPNPCGTSEESSVRMFPDGCISFSACPHTLFPFFIIAFGIKRLLGREGHKIYLLGGVLFLISSSVLCSLLSDTFHYGI